MSRPFASVSPLCRHLPRVFAFLFFLLPGVLSAAGGEGLYEAARPVADQGEDARGEALREGLAEVLIRVTGDARIAAREGAREVLADPLSLAQQYRYERDSVGPGLRLHMVFDPAALEALLRRHALPVWGRERPETLVWLAVDDGRRRLVSGEDGERYARRLERAAERRGIPLLFPLLDLEERRAVTAADLWGGFDDAAREASHRYGAASVLLVRLQREQGVWRGRWTWYAFDETRSWATEGKLGRALSAGVDELADALAGRFVVAGGAPEDVRLAV